MTKEILGQYADMKEEAKEAREKIRSIEADIARAQKRLSDMASEKEMARDKVYGGYGGRQGFVIEGFPSREYGRKQSALAVKKALLDKRKASLEDLESDILRKTNDIEKFIAQIGDSHTRRIVSLRVIEGLAWRDVAKRMGNATEGSVKMAFQRFFEKD